MPLSLPSIASSKIKVLMMAVKLIIVMVVTAVPVALPGCPEACGNITVPYPSGVGQGCFRAGFNLTCDETHHPPKLLVGHNVQVFDISLPGGTARIHSRALNASSLQYNGSWSAGLMGAGALTVSTTYNVFVAIGCNLLARLVVNPHRDFASICAALCLDGSPRPESIDSLSCSGVACCQMSISQGSPSYGVQLKDLDQADSTGYGAAFIVDGEWFGRNEGPMLNETLSFFSPDPYLYGTRDVNAKGLIVPTVLEWFLDVKRDGDLVLLDTEISGWRCISLNSSAVVAGESEQIRCNCSDGFEGNPYIINGYQGGEPYFGHYVESYFEEKFEDVGGMFTSCGVCI